MPPMSTSIPHAAAWRPLAGGVEGGAGGGGGTPLLPTSIRREESEEEAEGHHALAKPHADA